MKFLSKYKLTFIGVAVGAVAGYAYYYFVGCSSGTCPITSHPFNSTAYGAIMGALLFTSFKKENSNNKKFKDEKQQNGN
jgi:uncharacterized membrane protein YdjX (TVP38/TMEM64 family)